MQLSEKINNVLQEYEDIYLKKKDYNILPELLGIKKILTILFIGKYSLLKEYEKIKIRINRLIEKILNDNNKK